MVAKKSSKFETALAAQQSTRERDYWLNKLAGFPDKVSFPFDRKKGVNERRIDTVNRIFPEEISLSFSRISKGVDHALHMVLTAALLVLLHKYTGSDDIIMGMPIYKQSVEAEFINTAVALRNKISVGMTFKELLLQVRQIINEAVENQNYPIEILSEQLNATRDNGSNSFPLFDVVILLQNIHDKAYIEDISINMVWCFNFDRVNNRLEIAVEYNALFYNEDTILRLIDHWMFLVQQVLANNDLPISEVSLISESEKKQLLDLVNGPGEPLDMEHTIHGLFKEQAEKSSDGVVVVCEDRRVSSPKTKGVGTQDAVTLNGSVHLTYKELDQKSDQLACLLHEKGVQSDTVVGVMVEPCFEMVIAVLSILKAGGCYLPVDPEYPRERIYYMLKDGNAKVLLAAPAAQVKVEVKVKAKPIELIDISEKFSSFPSTSTLTLSEVNSANLAYIMYTSGSTGRPKAVMVEHRSVVRLVKNANYIHFQEDDRILQTGSLSFDASTFEIWGALLNGLMLYLAKKEDILDPRRLDGAIKDWKITIIWMTSGLFNWMCQTDVEIFSGLKYLLVGGDVLSPMHINKVRRRYPDLIVINGYGPTENTTFSTTHRIDREYEENIPIGSPISNSSAFIVDKDGYPLPVGVAGELVVGGEGVARGYMNRPEITAEKFVLVHSSWLIALRREKKVSSPGELPMSYSYKTGDLVRWLPEGALEFLGRKDQQIKIRGQRIELGEIESQLLKHPDIKDVVVIDRDVESGEKYLCAYIIPDHSAGTTEKAFNMEAMREFLSHSLPDYMIPAYFVTIDRIPLTPNSKVDRKKLPEPKSTRPQLETAYLEPSSRMEKLIADAWKEILRLDKIGINDNFFDLGGDSFRLVQASNKLKTVLNKEIPVMMMFQYPTIHSLAQYLKEEETQDKTPVVERKAHLEKKLDKGKARLKATRKKIK